jgi:hypothetical protein
MSILRVNLPTLSNKKLLIVSIFSGIIAGIIAILGYKISNSFEVLMSQFGPYIVLAIVFATLAKTRKIAMISSTLALVCMCLVYYIPYSGSLLSYLSNALIWTIISLVAGPIFGVLGFELLSEKRSSYLSASIVLGLLFGEEVRMAQVGISQNNLSQLYLLITFNLISGLVFIWLLKPTVKLQILLYTLVTCIFGYTLTLLLR